MAERRFKLRTGTDTLTDREKFTKMKDKLGSLIEKHQQNAGSFSKYLLESKLLGSCELEGSEVKELLEMSENSARLNCDEQSEKVHKQNLLEIEALTGLHVHSCEDSIEKVIEASNKCRKKWTLAIQPDKKTFPDVVVTQEFITLESPDDEIPEILKLKVNIEGIDIDDELDEVLRHCEHNLEPQLVTRLVREYLPLNKDRQDILSNTSEHCSLRSGNIIEFTNSLGSVLANVCLSIKFDSRSLSWSTAWMCKLTDAGTTACNSMNIPSELSKTGTVSTWDWDKAVDTLAKVARLDMDTPERSGKGVTVCDFSNLDTSTPIRLSQGEELKRIPKRKLN